MKIKLKDNKQFFSSLTGIRAIAAWSVFLFHFNPWDKSSVLGGFINQLYIGVDIFFVLSGFLIFYRYYNSFKTSKKWFGKYIINRVARIYPIFFILTTITFIVGYITSIQTSTFTAFQITKNTGFHYFMNITFLKAFFHELRFSGIPQAWTLTIEECFYLSAPLIFLTLRKIKIWIQPFIWLFVGFLIVFVFQGNSYYGFFKDVQFMLIFTFFGRAFEFYIGIYLALILIKQKKIKLFKGYFTFVGVFGIIVLLYLVSLYQQLIFPPYGRIILTSFVLPFFIFALFYGLLFEDSFVKKVLEKKIMVFSGKSSYVFYLIHMGLFQIIINDYINNSILISFVLLNIISALLYKYIEEPLNLGIRQWYALKVENGYRNKSIDYK